MLDPFYGFSSLRHAVQADASASRSRNAADRADRSVRSLEDKLDKLTLVCLAMWSLMQDKTGVTEDELLERLKMLDLMDGVADGKATRIVAKCPKCNRTMSPRHKKCLYCGYSHLVQSAFDAI